MTVPSIDQLKELGLPAPVSYFPQTWGWWLLLGLLVVGLLSRAARRYWQWRRDRYRREALLRLAELERSGNQLAALRELPELLKRVALSMPPCRAETPCRSMACQRWHPRDRHREQALLLRSVASLSGEAWQAFLLKHSPSPLPTDFSQQLARLAYAPDATLHALPAEQRQQLFSTCKHWVERHHVAV